jgi:hypothetical protein
MKVCAMATMSVRSTYALDPETAELISRLAVNWGVSRAEVIRRSVRIAAEQQDAATLTPAEVMQYYRHQAPPRNWPETRRLIEQLRAERHEEDVQRTAWHRE